MLELKKNLYPRSLVNKLERYTTVLIRDMHIVLTELETNNTIKKYRISGWLQFSSLAYLCKLYLCAL